MTGKRATAGAAWLVSARLIARLVDLGTLLVLARLLTPSDFGVVAVAMTLIYIVEAILELPVASVLVHVQEPERTHYDTAFTLSLIRGAILGVVLCAVAWPYALAFDDPRLSTIIVALGLAPLMRGCLSPRLAHFARELKFGREGAILIAGKVGSFAAAVTMALLQGSYWALVVATVSGPAIMLVLSYAMAPYRPRLALGEISAFRDFLGWMSAAQVLGAINWQCDRLFLGKFVSRSEMGQFTVAGDLASLPIQALAIPIATPLFPALSRQRSEPERLHSTYLAGLTAIVTLCLPVVIGLAVLTRPIVHLALGAQWSPTSELVQLLALASAFTLTTYPTGALASALGHTKLIFQRCAIEFGVKLPLMFLGGYVFGLLGIAYARIVTEIVMMVVNVLLARRLIGVQLSSQLGVCMRPCGAVAVMAAVLVALQPQASDPADPISLTLALFAQVAIGGATYIGASAALWMATGRPRGLESELVKFVTSQIRRVRQPRPDPLLQQEPTRPTLTMTS